MQPNLVLPAIYRFDIPNRSKESAWGWHSGTELLKAVHNLMELQGEGRLTVERISVLYPECNPCQWDDTEKRAPMVMTIRDGSVSFTGLGTNDWLKGLTNEGEYIPAKVGLKLIDAIKHPVRRRIRSMFVD